MKLKFKNGGTIKLQNKGKVPNIISDHDKIVQYNLANGTHFYNMDQVMEHDAQKAASTNNKRNIWDILSGGSAESPGEAILNRTIETANNAQLPETREKIYKDRGKTELGTTVASLPIIPMLGEFSTYGLLGGASRLAGGMAGSAVGSYTLGKTGELGDHTFGTTWMKPAGQIIGGFAGWGPGSNIAWRSAAKIAPNRIIGDFVSGSLNKSVSNTSLGISDLQRNIEAGKIGWAPSTTKTLWHNSNEPVSQLKVNFPAWDITERNAPLGHVWLTGNETTQGFIGARPYHLQGKVELNKPMVQIGEAIGDGKNVTRNQILDFAQKSSADGINFQNIADNTLQNQDVYAVFKDVNIKPKLTEAEKLGIPKGERSNPQALENPQYWGYQQWNQRYNAAVESGNWDEAQRLRDLHFKIKAPDTKVVDENGNPLHTYHGFLPSRRVFTKFKGVNFDVERAVKEGSKVNHWKLSIPNEYRMTSYHTPNYNHALTPYASGHPDKVYDDYLYIKNPFTWNEENLHNILLNSGHKSEKIPFREPGHFRKIAVRDNNGNLIFKDSDKWIPEKSGFSYPQVSDWADFRGDSKTELMKLGYDGLYIPQYYDSYGAFVSPSQFKSAEPITWNGSGEIIPIVKRDNFHNLDRRYKQGGILKAQRGTRLVGLPIIPPSILQKRAFELVAKRSNSAQTKSIPTIITDVITGRDKSFYSENNSNGSNEIDTYLYGKPYNSEFTGDASVGPDYTNYINKNYPNRNIKTYNTHFGDTLYIDNKAKNLVEQQLNNGEIVGGSMGRYAHAPSYIVTTENGRPYDAGGHLIKFNRDDKGNIVANMSDIYDFLPEDFNDKYNETKNPTWTRKLANDIGTPFIVRQNNIPVIFKEIVPEYKTEKQKELGEFLSQWGTTYDLNLPLKLSDEQINEIFDGRDYGDDILDFMVHKGYIPR